MYQVRHRESGRVLADRCRTAETFWARLRGWTGHRPVGGEGLWLRPCAWVHTIGMRGAIDVILCGRNGEVRKVVSGLRPCRIAGAPGIAEICELPAGSVEGIAPGDHLDLAGIRRRESSSPEAPCSTPGRGAAPTGVRAEGSLPMCPPRPEG